MVSILPTRLAPVNQHVAMAWKPRRACLAALAVIAWTLPAHAETPADEGAKYLHVERTLAPLSTDLFGEEVNLYTGETTFTHTDADIPGNNALPVRVGRKLSVVTDLDGINVFGRWELDLPELHGVYSLKLGWAAGGADKTKRCSYPVLTPPEVQTVGVNGWIFEPDEYWSGLSLSIPGQADQIVLARAGANTHYPSSGGPYPLVTKEGWAISCLASVANPSAPVPDGVGEGVKGEAFLARAPDGTRYTFNWLVYRASSALVVPGGSGAQEGGALLEDSSQDPDDIPPPGAPKSMSRVRAHMLPTRVEDRFGNWVTYTYDAVYNHRLKTIASSDGRTLVLAYHADGRVATVSYGDGGGSDTDTRVIAYAYSGNELSTVTLPDTSIWSFGTASLNGAKVLYQGGAPDCSVSPPPSNVATMWSATMTHPSGAKGTFNFGIQRHGLALVNSSCLTTSGGLQYLNVAKLFDTVSLKSKSISGPGLATLNWTYAFGPPNDSWAPCPNCPTSKYVDVIDPASQRTRYTFDNRVQPGGQLIETAYGYNPGNQTALRKETMTYAPPTGQAWLASLGDAGSGRGDTGGPAQLEPLKKRVITQDGTTFTWEASTFDGYARPLNATQASAPGVSRSSNTTYHDSPSLWVLGQVATSTVAGILAAETSYDAKALPWVSKSFGKTTQTLLYNTDGTLASVKDGNSKTTGFSNWYRGVPRTITYADGYSKMALVGPQGWITQVADENGYATNYAYDPVGRLKTITYPTGDTPAWNSTTLAFEKVALPEVGIAGGHWRRTVSTGTGREISYYDALWRPLVVREYDTANETDTKRFKRYAYDHDGRTTFAAYPGASDALTTGLWTAYDAIGRTTSVSQDSELGLLITTHAYLSGFKTRITSPKNQQATITYQAWDNPVYDWPIAIAHPEGAYTDIARDTFGNPTALTRRNAASTVSAVRRYVYDANRQLCKTIEPETASTVYAYDGAGNLAWSAAGLNLPSTTLCNTADVVANQKVSRTYTARNQVKTLVFPDGVGNQAWIYSPDGLPSSVTTNNSNGGTQVLNTYLYNRRRLITSETMSGAGQNYTLGYGYSPNGHLTSHTYPVAGSLAYAVNALGQPTQAGTFATAVTYHPNGAVKSFRYGNNLQHSVTQNARQLPNRITDVAIGVLPLDLSYTYDKHGNVSATTDYTAAARQTRSMVIDGLDRLTSTTSPMFGTATYTYDVLDNTNTVKLTGGVQPRSHTYVRDATQRLTQVKQTIGGAVVATLGYDVRGNLASRGGQAYVFDHGNRLRSVAGQGGYLYDAHGRRIRDVSSAARYSFYDATGRLVLTDDRRQGKKTTYYYLGGQMIANRDYPDGGSARNNYLHVDAQGTALAITSSAKAISDITEYEPYGRLANLAAKDGPGYTGHVQDAATGLTYMQQRYYDSALGVFLSVDPVTALSNPVGAFNRYRYANNNPYKFTDPDGRRSCDGVADGCKDEKNQSAPKAREFKQSQVEFLHYDQDREKASTTAVRDANAVVSMINVSGNEELIDASNSIEYLVVDGRAPEVVTGNKNADAYTVFGSGKIGLFEDYFDQDEYSRVRKFTHEIFHQTKSMEEMRMENPSCSWGCKGSFEHANEYEAKKFLDAYWSQQ